MAGVAPQFPPLDPPGDAIKVGVIAGGGALPTFVAERAAARGYQVHVLGIVGEADPSIEDFPHDWMKWGQIGHMLNVLKSNACTELVIIGSVKRPDLKTLRIDLGAIRNLPLLLSILTGGDDSVLTSIVRFYEHHGLRVRGAHEIAPELLASSGLMAGPAPADKHQIDIAKGIDVVAALGRLDVGQAAVVARNYVLAVEAAEGTDRMLERCSALRQWGGSWSLRRRVGVLVKTPKPGQEMRVDMPTIGPKTVQMVSDAGLAGIAVTAGSVLLVDRATCVEMANDAGIFLFGVDDTTASGSGDDAI